MDFKELVSAFAFFALLVIAIFSTVIVTQDANNAPQNINENTLVNDTFNDLLGNLSDAQNTGETVSGVFGTITPQQDVGVLDVTAVVSPTKIFKTFTIGLFNILIRLPMQILGVNPVVASVISAILVLVLIIGIWAVWRGVVK